MNGVSDAISIASAVTDNLMQNFLWLADTAGSTVYKVSTELSPAHTDYCEWQHPLVCMFALTLKSIMLGRCWRFVTFSDGAACHVDLLGPFGG